MQNTQISKSVISKSIKLLQTAIISICVVTMSSITFAESEKHNDDSSLQIRHSTPPAKINIEELSEVLELNKVQSQQLKVSNIGIPGTIVGIVKKVYSSQLPDAVFIR